MSKVEKKFFDTMKNTILFYNNFHYHYHYYYQLFLFFQNFKRKGKDDNISFKSGLVYPFFQSRVLYFQVKMIIIHLIRCIFDSKKVISMIFQRK